MILVIYCSVWSNQPYKIYWWCLSRLHWHLLRLPLKWTEAAARSSMRTYTKSSTDCVYAWEWKFSITDTVCLSSDGISAFVCVVKVANIMKFNIESMTSIHVCSIWAWKPENGDLHFTQRGKKFIAWYGHRAFHILRFHATNLNKRQRKRIRFQTCSLWSPPTILILRICSLSSRSSRRSLLVVAGRPVFTFTSLTLPIPRSPPCTTHLLTKGLYFCGWSNLLTRDHTCWHEQGAPHTSRSPQNQWPCKQSSQPCKSDPKKTI